MTLYVLAYMCDFFGYIILHAHMYHIHGAWALTLTRPKTGGWALTREWVLTRDNYIWLYSVLYMYMLAYMCD